MTSQLQLSLGKITFMKFFSLKTPLLWVIKDLLLSTVDVGFFIVVLDLTFFWLVFCPSNWYHRFCLYLVTVISDLGQQFFPRGFQKSSGISLWTLSNYMHLAHWWNHLETWFGLSLLCRWYSVQLPPQFQIHFYPPASQTLRTSSTWTISLNVGKISSRLAPNPNASTCNIDGMLIQSA